MRLPLSSTCERHEGRVYDLMMAGKGYYAWDGETVLSGRRRSGSKGYEALGQWNDPQG